MKAAIALIFFACIAGSMAADTGMIGQLVQQGQVIAQVVLGQLQQQILGFAQQALGQLTSLFGSIGRFDLNLSGLFDQFKPIVDSLINQALGQVLGGLSGLLGGLGGRIDIGAIFAGLWNDIQGSVVGLGQHFLNQGLASVLGGLGGLGGRGIGDIFAGLTAQIGGALQAAQGALSGALGNLSALGAGIIDASKPHWEQLQEQLVGHGLNVLGSLSETINNLHGSITGGR